MRTGANASTTITASLGEKSDSFPLTTIAPITRKLEVTPADSLIEIGTELQLQAMVTDSLGDVRDVTNEASWESSCTACFEVSQTGLVMVVDGGEQIQITATYDEKNDVATVSRQLARTLDSITVAPIDRDLFKGEMTTFTAFGNYSYASGDTVKENVSNSVVWSSSDSSVVSFDASGQATVEGVGTAVIKATWNGKESTATVNVVGPRIETIEVTGDLTIAVDTTATLTATATYSDSTTKDVTSQALWSTSNPAVVQDANSGVIVAIGPGTSEIRASIDGRESRVFVVISPLPTVQLNSIDINLSQASIPAGAAAQLTAMGNYSDGTTKNITSEVTWSSSETSRATIDTAGLATGLAYGTTLVEATHQGISSEARSIAVVSAMIAMIDVSPSNPAIPIGTEQQFTATGIWTDGTRQDVSGLVTWSSSDQSQITISETTGLARVVGETGATISARLDRYEIYKVGDPGKIIEGLTSVNSGAAVPAFLQFNSWTTPLVGETLQLSAEVNTSDFAGWQSVPIEQVEFVSSDPLVVTISDTGLATAVDSGTALISAVWRGLQARSPVSPYKLERLRVGVANTTIKIHASEQFGAIGFYSGGGDNIDRTQVNTSQVNWESSDSAIATVTRDGLVTAVSAGDASISASYLGKTVSQAIVVLEPVLKRIELTPPVTTIQRGETRKFVATGFWDDGSQSELTQLVVWSSDQPSVVSIANSGLATGSASSIGVGTSLIHAMLDGKSATAEVNVVLPLVESLQSISVTPLNTSLLEGETKHLIATGNFPNGVSLDISDQVEWESNDSLVATISDSGRVKGVQRGEATITARLNNLEVSGQVTVNPNLDNVFQGTPNNDQIRLSFPRVGSPDNSMLQLEITTDGVQQVWQVPAPVGKLIRIDGLGGNDDIVIGDEDDHLNPDLNTQFNVSISGAQGTTC